jgi:hypothetical protein
VEAADGGLRMDAKAVFFENGLCRQQAEKYQRASSLRILAFRARRSLFVSRPFG